MLTSTRDELIRKARLRSPTRSAEMIGLIVDARLQTSPNAFEVLTPPNPDYRTLIAQLKIPTLLLIGDNGVIGLKTAQNLYRLAPALHYEVVTGAGHGMPYDEPERLGTLIQSFLNQRIQRRLPDPAGKPNGSARTIETMS